MYHYTVCCGINSIIIQGKIPLTPGGGGEISADVIWGKKYEKAKKKRRKMLQKKEERGKNKEEREKKIRKGEVKG